MCYPYLKGTEAKINKYCIQGNICPILASLSNVNLRLGEKQNNILIFCDSIRTRFGHTTVSERIQDDENGMKMFASVEGWKKSQGKNN